ncbi:MAG: hypothetical protein ACXVB9_00610 [Bdellovibrionota bacterium]
MSLSAEALFARLAALMALALSLGTLWLMFASQRSAYQAIEVRAGLRKLAALTIRNFPERDLDSPDLFWKSIGREDSPMRDVWGTVYQVSSRTEAGKKTFFWASAGPDRRFGTGDDIEVEVPYPNGPSTQSDLAPGEPALPPPVSLDAK